MKPTPLRSIDLNLLSVAQALFRHRNVSKAATDLGLTQSAVSHALARLRVLFGDQLFVRASKGVVPTDFALGIQAELMDLLSRAESLVSRRTQFSPELATGRVCIAGTDYIEAALMPRLATELGKFAPGLQLSMRPTHGELPKRDLEDGRVDIAIAGFYRNLPEGFFQAKLFTDDFSVAAGPAHPLYSRGELGLEDYFEARHALATLQGDFRDEIVARVGKRKLSRNIVYGSYSFTGLAWVLQGADLLLTAPSLLLKRYQEHFPIRIWPGPVDLGEIDIRMVWQARTHEDALHRWIRAKLREIAESLS